MNLLEFENTSALDAELVSKVVDLLTMAIDQHGYASLVVSGGRTPKGFFHLLSQEFLDWSKVTVTLADERWVPEGDSNSNTALIKAWLLQNEASDATFYPIYTGEKTAYEGQQHCQQELSSMHFPLDVLVLGMGNDGHTASLFPYALH